YQRTDEKPLSKRPLRREFRRRFLPKIGAKPPRRPGARERPRGLPKPIALRNRAGAGRLNMTRRHRCPCRRGRAETPPTRTRESEADCAGTSWWNSPRAYPSSSRRIAQPSDRFPESPSLQRRTETTDPPTCAPARSRSSRGRAAYTAQEGPPHRESLL